LVPSTFAVSKITVRTKRTKLSGYRDVQKQNVTDALKVIPKEVNGKKNGKVVPVHTIKASRGNRGMCPLINLGTGWR
jgi:hypothetical protein